MTAAEKQTLAAFLDTASDYLRDCRARDRPPFPFTDDLMRGGAPPLGRTPLLRKGMLRPTPPSGGEPPATPPGPLPPEVTGPLHDAAAAVEGCRACGLARTRTRSVPGEGIVPPLVLVVGEAPGAEEDASGRPFVGPAGCLLDDMLAAIGLSRLRNCFIANVVKCRPPNNRLPTQDETAACLPFLCRQIAALRPRVILAAGRVAAHNLLGIEETMGRLRGTLYPYRLPPAFAGGAPSTEIPLIATYHPSALLRDPGLKRPAFDDLKFLMAHLASLDPVYRAEAQPLINKYAAKDSRLAPLAE